MNEIEKLNAICFILIGKCIDTNADEMNIEQKNVTRLGKILGDWKISVKKLNSK